MKNNQFANGEFAPKHPEKYIGTYPIIYRSSWELVFCNVLDRHPNVKQWASESIKIPYWNPFKNGAPRVPNTIYVPDFLISYIDTQGKSHVEVVEIKPFNQTVMEKARGTRGKIAVATNKAKWAAATVWCRKNGIKFRVITERDMFEQLGKKK